MVKIRAVFEKRNRAKYISHLDLNRCMQRTFKRSGLPVWYTEGFNPHIYIAFAIPLSLGYESSCELMEFSLTEDVPREEIIERLNTVMPEGLKVLRVYESGVKFAGIRYARYTVRFEGDGEELRRIFERFMSQDEINTVKRTKKGGEKLVDLKPDTEIKEISADADTLNVTMILPAGNEKNLNPSLLTDLFSQYCEIPCRLLSVERTGIFSENGKEFF